jgi:hypothetical protein
LPPGPSVAPSRREAKHADQYAEPFDADELALDAEEPLDGALGLLVASFADVVVTDDAVHVDEVPRRPVVVVEGAPNCVVVVDRDGLSILAPGRLPDAADLVLGRELGRVDADEDNRSVR